MGYTEYMNNETPQDSENPDSSNQSNTSGPSFEPATPLGERRVGLAPSKGKKLLIVLIIVLLFLGGAATAWFIMKDKPAADNKSAQNTNNSKQSQQTQNQPLQPFAVAYAHRTDGGTSEGCAQTQTSTYWRPIGGGERMTAFDAGKQMYTNHFQTYQNKAFVITEPGCGSTEGLAVWYSKDAGKTYTKVFTGKPATETEWEQITSARFASDGKSILIAFLPADGKNTVKEINPDTKAVKNLFSVESDGVFIQGYDSAKKQVYYFAGCYNCDGNRFNKLFVHDLTAKTDTTLFEDKDYLGMDTKINSDFTKVLRVKGPENMDVLGPGKPFTIEEFDIASKSFKKLQTIDEEALVRVGYREDDGLAYYVKDKAIYNAASNAVLFESSKPIVDTFLLTKDQVIASTGTFSDFSVVNFTISTKATINVFTGDDKTTVFGVTWE